MIEVAGRNEGNTEMGMAQRKSASSKKGTRGSGSAQADNPTIAIRDNEIVLNAFHETDPEVVELARKADDGDAEAVIHNALQIGARAIRLAQVSVDTMVVESAFDGMSHEFDEKLEELLGEFSETTEGLLDQDDGALPQALKEFRGELEELLDQEFDHDSKTSIIGRFDELMRTQRDGDRDAIRKLLDTGSDDSPLYRLQRDLTKSVRDESETVRALVQEVSEKIAATEAASEMFEKSVFKGETYEELVHDALCQLVTPFGDTAERTGTIAGPGGSKKGDEVVTLNPDDTPGADARYVIEVKARGLSTPKTFEELEGAMENRDAGAGIAVFSNQDNAPSSVPFSYKGDCAIVVLDKDERDPSALRLATMWARWVVRRKLGEEEREVDTEAIEELVEQASKGLAHQARIKRYHTAARKSIDKAGEEVSALVGEVDEALEALRLELHG